MAHIYKKTNYKSYKSHRTEISENLKTNPEIRDFLNDLHPKVLNENSFLKDMKDIQNGRKDNSVKNSPFNWSLGQRRGITNWMKNEKLTKEAWVEYQEKFKPLLLKLETIYNKLSDQVGIDTNELEQVEKYKKDLSIYNYISKTRMKRVNEIFLKYFPET